VTFVLFLHIFFGAPHWLDGQAVRAIDFFIYLFFASDDNFDDEKQIVKFKNSLKK
jgi:hypothetical protein